MKKILLLILISISCFSQTVIKPPVTAEGNLTIVGQALGIISTTTGPNGIKGVVGMLPISGIITLNGLGSVTTTGTNPFTINSSITTITSGGNLTVSGGFPSYTITGSAGGSSAFVTPLGVNLTIAGAGTGTPTLTGFNSNSLLGKSQHLGTIYNKSSWTDFSDFDKNSITTSIVGTSISITGTSGSLDIKNSSSIYENWIALIQYQINSITGTSNGLGIGTRSVGSSGTNFSIYANCPITTVAGSGISNITSPTLTINKLTGTITGVVGDVIEVITERIGSVIIAKSRNITSFTGWSVRYYEANTLVDNTAKLSIYALGGSNVIQKIFFRINDRIGVKVLAIGDSKAKDGTPTYFSGRYMNIVAQYYNIKTGLNDYTVDAGGGDQTIDVLNRWTSIVNKYPQNVLLNIGSNDQRNGVSVATYRANYISIVQQATTAGHNVIHLLPFPEASLDFSAQYNWIITTFAGMQMIDTWNALKNPGDNFLSATYNVGDGVHLNDAGQAKVANTIIRSGYLDKYVEYYSEPSLIGLSNGLSNVPSNIFAGLLSGQGNLVTGLGNSTFGYNATPVITSGMYNSVFGNEAGNSLTTAQYSSLFGYQAGFSLTSPLYSTFIGTQAGYSNTTGANNVDVGLQTGYLNVTSSNNTNLGYQAGYTATGGNNTNIGSGAGQLNASGTGNLFAGFQAGNGAKGSSCIGLGNTTYALSTTAATNNIAIGNAAMFGGNISGSTDIGIGYQALYNLSSGTGNIGMGQLAGAYITSGTFNTVIGDLAGGLAGYLTTSTGVLFLGANAGYYENLPNKLHITNAKNYAIITGDMLTQNLSMVCLTTPGTITPTTSATGGNMPAGTYFYKLTAINLAGESNPSAEVGGLTTSGSTSSISFTWPTVPGAISYRLYRGIATNSEIVYYTTTGISFTDTYSTTIAGTVPNFNTAFNLKVTPTGVSVSGILFTNGNQVPSSGTVLTYTDANNSGTGETVLYINSFTGDNIIPNTASYFNAWYSGTMSNIASNKTVRIVLANQEVFTSGAMAPTAGTGSFEVSANCIRTGASTARCSVRMEAPALSSTVIVVETDLTGLDFSVTQALKLLGTSSIGSNEVTAKLSRITFTK